MNKAKRILNEIVSLEQQLAKIQRQCKHNKTELIPVENDLKSVVVSHLICSDCQKRI